jgi:hypothetical protein
MSKALQDNAGGRSVALDAPGIFVLGSGLLIAILGSAFSALLFSIPLTYILLSYVALGAVWLDGILTHIGINRGLEEANPLVNILRGIAGNNLGLLISRVILSGLILCFMANLYVLAFIAVIFSACVLSNIAKIGRAGFSGNPTSLK